MNKNKTLVIGASFNPERYSNLAIRQLLKKNYPVIALGQKPGSIEGVSIETEKTVFAEIDTVTLYINPTIQKEYYNYILSLQPRRIIFNPGTENDEFEALAKRQGIQTIEACTLVLLSTGQY